MTDLDPVRDGSTLGTCSLDRKVGCRLGTNPSGQGQRDICPATVVHIHQRLRRT